MATEKPIDALRRLKHEIERVLKRMQPQRKVGNKWQCDGNCIPARLFTVEIVGPDDDCPVLKVGNAEVCLSTYEHPLVNGDIPTDAIINGYIHQGWTNATIDEKDKIYQWVLRKEK